MEAQGIILILIVIIIVTLAINMSTDPNNNVSKIGQKTNRKKNILSKYPNSKYRLFTNECNDYLIISEKDHVFMSNYEVLEKNRMRILTIVPTFDKQTILKGINIEIHVKKGSTIIASFDNRTNLIGARTHIEKFKYMVEDIKNTQQHLSNIEN